MASADDITDGQHKQFEASQGIADATQFEDTLPAQFEDTLPAGENAIQAAKRITRAPSSWDPEVMPDGAPAGNDPDWDQCSQSEQVAIQQYAKEHGLAADEVRLADVKRSKEGVLHYAMMGQDWGSRSNLSQCFKRALKHQAGDTKIYLDLDERLRKEYRASWGLKRDFQLLGFPLVHI
jgi:hypothetical protein